MNVKVGLGNKVHKFLGNVTRYGHTFCGIGGQLTPTKLPITCKSCRRLMKKEMSDVTKPIP